MLFYDQNGALAQFQGFNNSTHEYRINNIAAGGSIDFMIGSTSKFLVANNGFIEVSPADDCEQRFQARGAVDPLGNQLQAAHFGRAPSSDTRSGTSTGVSVRNPSTISQATTSKTSAAIRRKIPCMPVWDAMASIRSVHRVEQGAAFL